MLKAKKKSKIKKPIDATTAQLNLEKKIANEMQQRYKTIASRMEAILKRSARLAKSYTIKKDDTSDNSDIYDYPPDTAQKVADELTPKDIILPLSYYMLMHKIGVNAVAQDILLSLNIDPTKDAVFSGANWDGTPSKGATQGLKDRQQWMAKTVSNNRSQGVKDIVTKGIKDSSSYQEIQAQIENYLGLVSNTPNYMNPADMIAESETQWAVQESKRQTMADIGVTYVNIVTSPDAEEMCIALADENPYKIEEAQGMIPVHIHCHCNLETDWSSFYNSSN